MEVIPTGAYKKLSEDLTRLAEQKKQTNKQPKTNKQTNNNNKTINDQQKPCSLFAIILRDNQAL